MRDDIILGKMLHYAEKVCAYSAGLSYEDFRANDMLVEACVFNLGQMAWAQIYGLRNRIVHDYEGVNLCLIWEIISEDMPELGRALRAIKGIESRSGGA